MKTTVLWLMAVLLLPATLAAQVEPKNQPPASTTRPDGGVRPPASQSRISSRVYVGEAAPGFELISATGARVKLSRYRGDRILLMFVLSCYLNSMLLGGKLGLKILYLRCPDFAKTFIMKMSLKGFLYIENRWYVRI